MAELSKQALKVENNTEFPNNNNGQITPSRLRGFNEDMIDSLVDEISYNADSASWNQQIDALEQFTASAAGLSTGSLLVTASATSNVITFTKGDASTFNVTIADTTDLGPLNTFTASAQVSLNNLNLWTSSYQPVITNLQASQSIDNTKWNNISTQSGSWDTTNLNAYTASNNQKWDNLASQSGSFVTESETGSFARTDVSNTFTQANTFTSISASSFVSASAFIGDGTKITGITASVSFPILDEGIPQGNAVSMNFTGSGISAVIVGGTAIVSVNTPDSGTINNLTQSFNSYTQSNDAKWSNLGSQSGSWITESESGSFLVTASVNLNTITFTKGDASTFNITVNTGSGGGGTADLTSLNAFTASQETKNATLASVTASLQQQLTNIGTQSGSWVTSAITASSIITASVSDDDITFTKGDGSQFTIQVATGSFALSSSFAETSSITNNVIVIARNGEASTLGAGTVVHITGASGDNPIFTTASFDTEALSSNTFGLLRYSSPAGADVQVVVSGIVTGVNTDPALGYAAGDIIYLSSSGQFTNVQPQAPNQIVTLGQVLRAQQNNGSIYVSINNGWELNELHNVQINNPQTNELLAYESASYGLWKNKSIGTLGLATTGSNTFDGNQIISGGVTLSGSLGITYVDGGAEVIQQVTALGNYQTLYDGGLLFQTDGNNDYEQTIHTTLSKGLTVASGSVLNDGVTITGGLTGSLQNGYAWVGNVAGVSVPVPTSSFAGGASINTGSFATTGSNNFFGAQQIRNVADTSTGNNGVILTTHSGSLILTNNGFTTGSYGYISASASGQTNIIMQQNSVSPDFIVSGSFNITAMPAAPTAGFKRFIGIGNIALAGGNVPQISGSMAYPITMNNNIVTSNGTTITMRGPVSSSTWTINSNVIGGIMNIGSSAANNAQSLVAGVNMNQNTIPGTFSIIAAQTGVNFNQAGVASGNYIGGAATLNLSGSAIGFNNNIVNDSGTTIINGYYSSSIGLGQLAVNRNNFAGQSQTMFVSGAIPAGTTGAPSYSDNAMFGGANTIFTNVSAAPITGGLALHSAVRNFVAGNQLVITGSSNVSLTDTYGSAFVGRWNANDGIRNRSGQNVFVVGTGVNDTTRKTGFLIDSGSNTFIEGTLNVSGATSLNGNLVITGSLTASLQQGYVWVGDASGKTTTVATSSFGGGGAAFPYTGNAVITGSLGISGSMFGGVVALSVATSTASVDFSAANMFTLTLPSASTHINPTNIRAGQTVNIQITQPTPGTGSVTFPSNVKFAGGNDYQATQTGSAIDMLTLVSYDGVNVLGTSIKNFL